MLNVNEIERHDYDVIIIGAGGAGLRAAIECSNHGLTTGIICKSLLGKAHTVMAEGGMAAALGYKDKRDNWKIHFRDTMFGGKFLNNSRMAQLHAQQAPERVKELEDWGAVFDRLNDGLISQRNFGGHYYPRLAHVGDRTGLELIRTLQDKTVHSPGVKVHMECTVLDLLKDGDRVAGAIGYWKETGRFVLFTAKAVVLATGSIGKSWRITSNSWESTGDGVALAYEAGAELLDMEFTQFHPTGMVWPPSVRGTLVTEGVRGDGGVLLNNKGERFMFNYIPDNYKERTAADAAEADRWLNGDEKARRPPELLTRDVVARAINAEVKAGRGSPHGGAFLDIANKRPAEFIRKRLPSMYHQFKELAELDITREPMEVGPTMHYAMGGVRVDPETQMSRVPGLFAAGEVSGGMHGANRLGGNSLSDLIVFGKLAGDGAAAYVKACPALALDEAQVMRSVRRATDILNRESGENPYAIHEALMDMMQANVGIIRIKHELEKAVEEIAKLKARATSVKAHGATQYNAGWHEALDLRNLLIVSESVARHALLREESRGGHTREDFPGDATNKEWAKWNIVTRKGADGQMECEKIPHDPTPPELQAILDAKPEELEG
ncbi:MAG: fumarate reductase/succinate dehydrogenase flavoprotein subunit [Deltaproteobacteria bacterium]|nr:fumarate reductase/succinate dehydrogenase flavoprotein subunit [Deltaproteobacteria bacterium]